MRYAIRWFKCKLKPPKNEDAPPIPPRKHVHFTSTPCHPVQPNLFDSDDDNPITGHPGKSIHW